MFATFVLWQAGKAYRNVFRIANKTVKSVTCKYVISDHVTAFLSQSCCYIPTKKTINRIAGLACEYNMCTKIDESFTKAITITLFVQLSGPQHNRIPRQGRLRHDIQQIRTIPLSTLRTLPQRASDRGTLAT